VPAAASGGAGHHHAGLVGDHHELGAVAGVELHQQPAHVGLHRGVADVQSGRDLSIFERTREIGLLRAVGMGRSQVRSTVRWESIIIAVFGTTLGLAIGTFFGWAIVRAMAGEGIDTLSVPVDSLVVVTVIAALAGAMAAVMPARRAAKLDVLTALVTEWRSTSHTCCRISAAPPLGTRCGVAEICGVRTRRSGRPDGRGRAALLWRGDECRERFRDSRTTNGLHEPAGSDGWTRNVPTTEVP
jgi:FtsX-like permease family